MNLLETVHGEMHNEQTNVITKHILGARHRSAVVVTGPTLSGKKMYVHVIITALSLLRKPPGLHFSPRLPVSCNISYEQRLPTCGRFC